MNIERPQKKKRSCLTLALLIPFLLILAVLAVVSLNMLKNGNLGELLNRNTQIAIDTQTESTISETSSLNVPKDVKTFMLLGSDYRPQMGYRTDVILLVSVNVKQGKVNLLSFPRDLWVNIPGWEMQRINTAQPHGGFELLGDTLAENFGFRPNNYALIDFEGFKSIIDLLGGIDVRVEKAMSDECNFNDSRWCTIEPGIVPMDGEYALWYVRARYNSSDFDRTRRAQEVVQAVVKRSFSIQSLMKAPQLISAANEFVETTIQTSDLLPLLFRIGKLTKADSTNTFTIGPNEATGWITPGGADVLLPNNEAIHQILLQVLWIDTDQP